jgi:hypothetical protein
MTNGPGAAQLPKHVVQYLQRNGVSPNDLTPEALETLAGLTSGELALLQYVGDSLKSVEDKNVVLRVH